MFGISWYEFLVIIIISFLCLKPADFRKIIVKVRDIINFINSLITETKEKIEQSLTLDELKIEDFYIIDKKETIKETKKEPSQNIIDKKETIKETKKEPSQNIIDKKETIKE